MGTELGNLCSLLCIFILHVSILTHALPSSPLLTFGARHSHCCGRLYACSRPGAPSVHHLQYMICDTSIIVSYHSTNLTIGFIGKSELLFPKIVAKCRVCVGFGVCFVMQVYAIDDHRVCSDVMRSHVFKFHMLSQKMLLHINVTRGWFVGRMQSHSN